MRTSARFRDFVEIAARFNSTGKCGHEIKRGDAIGYSHRFRHAVCTKCWTRWTAENAEAALLEG